MQIKVKPRNNAVNTIRDTLGIKGDIIVYDKVTILGIAIKGPTIRIQINNITDPGILPNLKKNFLQSPSNKIIANKPNNGKIIDVIKNPDIP